MAQDPSAAKPNLRLTIWFEALSLSLAALFVVAFVAIAWKRLFFRFEISWSESALYSMMLRRIHGQPMYAAPSVFDGSCCLYPPFYVDLSAWVARALHLDMSRVSFLPLRLVSILSCLGIFGATIWILRRRKKLSWPATLTSSAVFLATYGRMELWHDNARVDSLLVFLLFISSALLLEGRRVWSAAIGGVVGGLAVLTKQPALLLLGLVGVETLFIRRQWLRGVTFAVCVAACVLGYLAATGDLWNPLFYFWIFKVPGSHPLLWKKFVLGPAFFALVIPVVTTLALIPFIGWIRSGRQTNPDDGPAPWSWSLVFSLWMLVLLLLRAKQGASLNFFMPLIPMGAIAAAEGLSWIQKRGFDVRRISSLALTAQLIMLAYDPTLFVPTEQARKEAENLVDDLKTIDGPVWFPAFPSYAAMAGKPWVTHYGTLTDLSTTNPGYIAGALSILVRERALGALIVHPGDPNLNRDELNQYYQEQSLPEIRSPFLKRVHDVHFDGHIFTRRQDPEAHGD
jgi:hypothetical protein